MKQFKLGIREDIVSQIQQLHIYYGDRNDYLLISYKGGLAYCYWNEIIEEVTFHSMFTNKLEYLPEYNGYSKMIDFFLKKYLEQNAEHFKPDIKYKFADGLNRQRRRKLYKK